MINSDKRPEILTKYAENHLDNLVRHSWTTELVILASWGGCWLFQKWILSPIRKKRIQPEYVTLCRQFNLDPEKCTDKLIHSRYRKLAKFHHPDRSNLGGSEEKFKKLVQDFAKLNELRIALGYAKAIDNSSGEKKYTWSVFFSNFLNNFRDYYFPKNQQTIKLALPCSSEIDNYIDNISYESPIFLEFQKNVKVK